eukprot:8845969-Pyramimonas_sp.AAC.1
MVLKSRRPPLSSVGLRRVVALRLSMATSTSRSQSSGIVGGGATALAGISLSSAPVGSGQTLACNLAPDEPIVAENIRRVACWGIQ